MYNWEREGRPPALRRHADSVVFAAAACAALLSYALFHPEIDAANRESPALINAMFAPALAIGFLYGARVTEKAVRPSETRSRLRRSAVKVMLFFFIVGGMFSAVGFALNGGSAVPERGPLDVGPVEWAAGYVESNGGATFLIVSSISLMAAATRRLIRIGGAVNRLAAFAGTFGFFAILVLSFTGSDPTHSSVYLYTFYQAGVVGGALYEMNRLTRNYNDWEDYKHGSA